MLCWIERHLVSGVLGVLIALLYLAFSFQSNQAALSHSNKEKIIIIGLEEQGLLQTWAIDADPSTPIGAVLQGILLHSDIDRLEICETKRIGSLLHKRLILPRKKMKTAVFEGLESGQIFRFDLPLHAGKFELLRAVEKKLGSEVAQKVLLRKRTIFHIEHFFFNESGVVS
ncbi:MAG: hypothetical protein QRY74_00625 [Chlamydia sp.]